MIRQREESMREAVMKQSEKMRTERDEDRERSGVYFVLEHILIYTSRSIEKLS